MGAKRCYIMAVDIPRPEPISKGQHERRSHAAQLDAINGAAAAKGADRIHSIIFGIAQNSIAFTIRDKAMKID